MRDLSSGSSLSLSYPASAGSTPEIDRDSLFLSQTFPALLIGLEMEQTELKTVTSLENKNKDPQGELRLIQWT